MCRTQLAFPRWLATFSLSKINYVARRSPITVVIRRSVFLYEMTRLFAQPTKCFHRDRHVGHEIVDWWHARILSSFFNIGFIGNDSRSGDGWGEMAGSPTPDTCRLTTELKTSRQVSCHHVGTATWARAMTVFQPTWVRVWWGRWQRCDATVCRRTGNSWDHVCTYSQLSLHKKIVLENYR
jgi:hypothetical protein